MKVETTAEEVVVKPVEVVMTLTEEEAAELRDYFSAVANKQNPPVPKWTGILVTELSKVI